MPRGVHLPYGVREFIRPGDGLDGDVFFPYAGGFEGLDGAGEEGGDDFGVPAGVEDAYAEGGACWEERVSEWGGSWGRWWWWWGGRTIVGFGVAYTFDACHWIERLAMKLGWIAGGYSCTDGSVRKVSGPRTEDSPPKTIGTRGGVLPARDSALPSHRRSNAEHVRPH